MHQLRVISIRILPLFCQRKLQWYNEYNYNGFCQMVENLTSSYLTEPQVRYTAVSHSRNFNEELNCVGTWQHVSKIS